MSVFPYKAARVMNAFSSRPYLANRPDWHCSISTDDLHSANVPLVRSCMAAPPPSAVADVRRNQLFRRLELHRLVQGCTCASYSGFRILAPRPSTFALVRVQERRLGCWFSKCTVRRTRKKECASRRWRDVIRARFPRSYRARCQRDPNRMVHQPP